MTKIFSRGGGLILVIVVFTIALLLAQNSTGLAEPLRYGSPESGCIGNGGTWTPGSGEFGTCDYPANNAVANNSCGPDAAYTVTYNPDESVDTVCTPVSPGSPGAVPYRGCRSEIRGPLEAPDTIYACNGKNGQATFPAGACELKCTLSIGLPSGPARRLPGHAVATLYVRVVDGDQSPGDDNYVVCFNINDEDLNQPAIYRFVSGAWIWQPATISGNKICANGSGDGAYFLGEAPSG